MLETNNTKQVQQEYIEVTLDENVLKQLGQIYQQHTLIKAKIIKLHELVFMIILT